MEILPLGHSSFRIRGKTATIVTDPYDSMMVGMKFPKHIEANIVTVSHAHPDHNAVSQVEGPPFVISGPGEYEVKGVSVIGVSSFHDAENGADRGRNTMYRFDMDGVKIAHLGDLGHVLSSAVVDILDGIDILMIPVGGVFSLDAQKATQVIADIEPRIVIPMHYKTDQHNPKQFEQIAPVSDFLKAMGKEAVTPVPKLTISRDKLPAEMQVIVLE